MKERDVEITRHVNVTPKLTPRFDRKEKVFHVDLLLLVEEQGSVLTADGKKPIFVMPVAPVATIPYEDVLKFIDTARAGLRQKDEEGAGLAET